eukprot:Skav235348  [mRNA]  locus=scaffold520:1294531:1295634:- [translate_table: standard]
MYPAVLAAKCRLTAGALARSLLGGARVHLWSQLSKREGDKEREKPRGSTLVGHHRLEAGGKALWALAGGCAPCVCPCGMDALTNHGRSLGLSQDEILSALRYGRPLSDTSWVSAADPPKTAKETFESGRYLEYTCRDNSHREQGKATIQLQTWEDEKEGVFNGRHAVAEDDYYTYYIDHQLPRGCAFHLCEGKSRDCRKRLPRADRRELIHLDHWRLVNPEVLVGSAYTKGLGTALGKDALDAAARAKERPAPGPAPGARGTGLDDLIQEAPQGEVASGSGGPPGGDPRKKEQEKARKRSRSRKRAKVGLADKLERQELKRREDKKKDLEDERGRSRRKKSKRRGGSRNERNRGRWNDWKKGKGKGK